MLKVKNRINALSGIRIFLILSIAAGHFIESYISHLPQWQQGLFTNYYFSTSFFFILSGFILTYVYFDDERGIRIPVKRFLHSRLSKIYPIHLLFIVIMAPRFFSMEGSLIPGTDITITKPYIIGSFFSQVFLLDAWNPVSLSVNGPAWSISALFFFYLLFPYFCRIIKNDTVSQLQKKTLTLWAIYLIYPICYIFFDLDSQHPIFEGLLHHNPLLRLPEFLIGMLVCRIYQINQQNDQLINTPFYMRLSPSLMLIVAILAYAIFPVFIPYALLHNGLFLPIQLVLILSLAADRDLTTRFLSHPFILKVSNASLTIFIAHYFILGWWGRVDQAFRFFSSLHWRELFEVRIFLNKLIQLKNQPTDVSFTSFLIGLGVLVTVSYFLQMYFVNPIGKLFSYQQKPSRVLVNS
ncbi:acyltransferase family protein [Xanthocytophaga flava]|uniref:acyltransferase family protein n=1 Tax=Xanthocytophaga flava TaxID=3048013 RepID=UPI0028D72019|nr:acyltransferase [Xanthocytophaga flavus]MDJ1468053.1 acyltransferase [Xanthocytophaga flavus]